MKYTTAILVALLAAAPTVARCEQTTSASRADSETVVLPSQRSADKVDQAPTFRSRLAERGVTVTVGLTNDFSSVAAGGLRRGSATRALFNGIVEGDLEAIAGWKGASFLVGFAAQRGANGSELAGDIQAFSNIDADRFNHPYEAWLQQEAGIVRLKVGWVDANTEFASVDAAGAFVNSSAGFSPTIAGLPTYPQPKLAANLFLTPVSWLQVGGGVFQGTMEDASDIGGTITEKFFIGQATATWTNGYAHVGHWMHTATALAFDGNEHRRPRDWFAAAEQRVSGSAESDDTPASGIRLFGKYGRAPGDISVFEQHLMFGAVRDGGLRPGSSDHAGVAVSHVDLSDAIGAGFTGDETAYELFYRLPLRGGITLRPDMQYIVHPSGDRTVRNSLVGTLRIDLGF